VGPRLAASFIAVKKKLTSFAEFFTEVQIIAQVPQNHRQPQQGHAFEPGLRPGRAEPEVGTGVASGRA
jgi:hypothetical protein